MSDRDIRFEVRDGVALVTLNRPDARNGFNFGMPKVMESTKSFKKAEVMVRIKCDVHSWMATYVGVLAHPFYSVSSGDGSFDLSELPAGTYTIDSVDETNRWMSAPGY